MNDSRTFTYQTRAVTDSCSDLILSDYADLYGQLERKLFQDLRKKRPINELKREYIAKHGITARQFNACKVHVEGKMDSVRKGREENLLKLKEKIASLDKKLPKIKDKSTKHHKQRKLTSMKLRFQKLQTAHKEDQISLCFGGKTLFHAQFHLEKNNYSSFSEWKEDWRKARSSEFFSLGSKDETSGNQSCSLTIQKDQSCTLRLRLPHSLDKKYGTKYLILSNIFFNYGHEELLKALQSKQALSYRFKKDEKGWRVFVSFTQKRAPLVTRPSLGAIGVDINVNHLAVTEIDAKGNPVNKKTITLCTYGKTKNQVKALVGDACKEIVAFAKEKQKPILAEKLDFTKKKARLKEEASCKQARMLSSFNYSHILQNLESRAFQGGIEFYTVSPALTSVIGRIKFAKRYGLSVHHAAALCIARRFFKFSEAPSQCPMKVVYKNIQVTCPLPERNRRQHVWKFWQEASKKLKTALAAHFRNSPDPHCCRSG